MKKAARITSKRQITVSASAPTRAHQGTTAYDLSKTLKLKGTIRTRFDPVCRGAAPEKCQ